MALVLVQEWVRQQEDIWMFKHQNFVKNYKSELKKVVWMPKNDLIKSTGIVLLVLVAAVVLIGLLDLGFSALLNLISSIG